MDAQPGLAGGVQEAVAFTEDPLLLGGSTKDLSPNGEDLVDRLRDHGQRVVG